MPTFTFQDIFKSSFLERLDAVSLPDAVIALALAFCLGLFIFLVYKKCYAGVMYAPGNVRVTLDRNLRTCGDSAGFLSTGAFPLKPLEGVTVLEVKYDAFLPDLVRLAVQTPDRRAGACSKYALCRRFD